MGTRSSSADYHSWIDSVDTAQQSYKDTFPVASLPETRLRIHGRHDDAATNPDCPLDKSDLESLSHVDQGRHETRLASGRQPSDMTDDGSLQSSQECTPILRYNLEHCRLESFLPINASRAPARKDGCETSNRERQVDPKSAQRQKASEDMPDANGVGVSVPESDRDPVIVCGAREISNPSDLQLDDRQHITVNEPSIPNEAPQPDASAVHDSLQTEESLLERSQGERPADQLHLINAGKRSHCQFQEEQTDQVPSAKRRKTRPEVEQDEILTVPDEEPAPQCVSNSENYVEEVQVTRNLMSDASLLSHVEAGHPLVSLSHDADRLPNEELSFLASQLASNPSTSENEDRSSSTDILPRPDPTRKVGQFVSESRPTTGSGQNTARGPHTSWTDNGINVEETNLAEEEHGDPNMGLEIASDTSHPCRSEMAATPQVLDVEEVQCPEQWTDVWSELIFEVWTEPLGSFEFQ